MSRSSMEIDSIIFTELVNSADQPEHELSPQTSHRFGGVHSSRCRPDDHLHSPSSRSSVQMKVENGNTMSSGQMPLPLSLQFPSSSASTAVYSNESATPTQLLIERCVVVARQKDGFGLTVTGEYPVMIEWIKPNGAAFVAGVREGDRILKVNGMMVTASNLQEVLRMISNGYNVALTLLGPPARLSYFLDQWDYEEPNSISSPMNNNSIKHNNNNLKQRRFFDENTTISDPNFRTNGHNLGERSVDDWRRQKARELFRMLAKERANLETLRGKSAPCTTESNPSSSANNQRLIAESFQRIADLQRQLNSVSSATDEVASCPETRREPRSTRSDSLPKTTDSVQPILKKGSRTFPPTATSAKAAAATVEPVKSWVDSGGMHYVQAADMVPMEDDDSENDENDPSDVAGDDRLGDHSGPFSNLQDLKTRPGHLAIFVNYLLHSGVNPSSLMFYLITDHFPSAAVKELRRFAYEIFSTFLIPNAPLQVPGIGQQIIQGIDKILRTAASASTSGGSTPSSEVEQMKRLFIPARTRAINDINEHLAEFRHRQKLGMTVCGGIDSSQLDSLARANHTVELRIAEQLLFKALEELLQMACAPTGGALDLDNCERKTLALLMAVASVIKMVLGLKPSSSQWEKLLDKCPMFLTPTKTSTTVLSKMRAPIGGGGGPKRNVQVKDHQFSLSPVYLTVYCYQCREAVWGVNPQAYFCQNCDVVVHKYCTGQLSDNCYPASQQKAGTKSGVAGSTSVGIAGGAKQIGGRLRSQVSASTASLNFSGPRPHLPPEPPPQSNRLSASHQAHRISDAFSVTGHESVGSGKVVIGRQPQRHHQPDLLQSTSLTPPLARSNQHSISAATTFTADSRAHHHHEDLLPLDQLDDESAQSTSAATAATSSRRSPLPPASSQRHSQTQSTTVGGSFDSSSPPSSQSMLPPPVFSSSRFERLISAPEPPPTIPNPPPDDSSFSPPGNAPPPLPPSLPPPPPPPGIDQGKSTSSDSGIECRETISAAGRGVGPPSRSQSMKSEATQVKRTGRGANSLGAADSSTTQGPSGLGGLAEETSLYEQPISSSLGIATTTAANSSVSVSNLGVPLGVGSARSAASSAHDLQQLVPSPSTAFDVSSSPSPIPLRAFDTNSTATQSSVGGYDAEETRRMLERVERTVVADGDSDLEVDNEVPSLESMISWEVLKHLKPKEKKRQEVINEFFHTERTHVRNLKILYKVFYRPLVIQRVASPDLIRLLFSNLDELLEIHSEMHQKMKLAKELWRRDGALEGLYGDIGELAEGMFDGPSGERLKQATALFCQNQQHALDTLRQRYSRSKEDPLSMFLVEAESNPLCRKFQLKDMIPVEMQRLVKYPLLLETIAKYTRESSDELSRLQNAVQCAKRILSAVNTAKRNAENLRRLDELQKRLDFTSGAGSSDKAALGTSFFQKFDFRQHRLIYEGPLIWRQTRGKTIDLHVVLLEHLLVFLTKTGDSGQRLQLKIHEAGCIPIMRLASVEIEEKAGDKRALTLLYKCDLRMFELVAATATERKTWHRLIENQVAVSRSSLNGGAAVVDLDGLLSGPTTNIPGGPWTPPQQVRARVIGDENSFDSGGGLVTARIEQVHILMHPSLVGANEITIQKPTVVENNANSAGALPPAERLRRNDAQIIAALAEKHAILARMLMDADMGNAAELERITETMTGLSVAELKQRSPRELAMSAIVQGNRLLESINKGMSVRSVDTGGVNSDDPERCLPSVPCYRLTAVAAPLMNHLKTLLQVIQDQEGEISLLRQQMAGTKEHRTASEETLFVADGRSNGGGPNTVVLKSIPLPPTSPPPIERRPA